MSLRTTTISILAAGLLAASALGVAAQDDARPAFFWWTYADGAGQFVEGTYDEAPGWMTMRDFMKVDLIEASDGRASGPMSTTFNVDSWGDPNANAPEIIEATSYAQRLSNDGGSWSGTGTAIVRAEDGIDPNGAGMVTLTGEGGYEGLTLILLTIPSAEGGTGFILPSVPPVPAPPAE